MSRVRLKFDRSSLEAQFSDLKALLRLQHVSDDVCGDLSCLFVDVVLGDSVTTMVTGEAVQVTRLRFGARFEILMAALRAGDWDGVAHVVNGLRGFQLALSC
jgi:hypothetical protein